MSVGNVGLFRAQGQGLKDVEDTLLQLAAPGVKVFQLQARAGVGTKEGVVLIIVGKSGVVEVSEDLLARGGPCGVKGVDGLQLVVSEVHHGAKRGQDELGLVEASGAAAAATGQRRWLGRLEQPKQSFQGATSGAEVTTKGRRSV